MLLDCWTLAFAGHGWEVLVKASRLPEALTSVHQRVNTVLETKALHISPDVLSLFPLQAAFFARTYCPSELSRVVGD